METLFPAAICAGFLALLLTINIRITRKIRRSDDLDSRKNLMIAMLWLVPFFGALGTLGAYRDPDAPVPGPVPRELLPKGFARDDAPAEVAIEGLPAFPLLEHMQAMPGLPLADWRAVAAWAAQAPDEAARHAAIDAARRAWLLHFRDALGEGYHLYESEHAWVLSCLELPVARAAADFVAVTRGRIGRVLEGVARFAAGEKSIVVVLADADDYYDYVAIYYPDEGEFAFSGGMFINAGCPHFVCLLDHLTNIEPVIAHELTHSALHHLRLPRWLDEGLAVNTEERVTREQAREFTPAQMHAKHLAFWNEERIAGFWSGESFFRADEGNLLSYDLARTLVAQMSRDWAAFARFVLAAQWADAGVAAARQALGLDLPAYVCGVLGRAPDPAWAPGEVPPEREDETQRALPAARRAPARPAPACAATSAAPPC